MKFFTKEVQIALVAVFGLVILFFGMKFLKGLSLFSKGNTYVVLFDNVTGLSASSPVYVNGVKVGTVTSIDCDYTHPDKIVASVGLDEQLTLPQGTQAEIVSDLLGNVRLELKLGDVTAARLAVGDTIVGGMQSGLMSKASDMVPQIEKMLPYESLLEHILKTFLASDAEANTVYEKAREVKNVALVVFASNSSLCGGFNSNIIKLYEHKKFC